MRKNVAGQRVEFSLGKGANRIANPTLAVGDFKVSLDGGAQNNVSTLPTSDAAGKVIWLPTQAETNADTVTFLALDVAGNQWDWLTLSWDTHDSTILAGLAASFAAIPAAVWTYVAGGGRTLTDYGTLVADTAAAVWAFANRTLTDYGTMASDIVAGVIANVVAPIVAALWGAPSRTLTQTAAQVRAAVEGSTLNVGISTTFEATLTGMIIPANWETIYFTIKDRKSLDDTQARVQIVVSNPADPTDGLLILNGAATTAAWGALVIDQPNGTATITIDDDATALLAERSGQYYDIKVLLDDGTSQQLTESRANVTHVVTRAIA